MLEKFHFISKFVFESFAKLGAKRLLILSLVGLALFLTILFSSFYFTAPSYETLYVGLSRDDINRIGVALGEADIKYDVTSDGTSIKVPIGTAERARMLLAEKGLPTSNNAGYELFDHMGSLGLTSFMQQITRQRALEGEIARTIQAVQGVRAARVHIVLPEKGSFRKADQKPTASVIIRRSADFQPSSAQAIRQLVAAAVPSLNASSVTIMDTTGHLLASGSDMMAAGSVLMVSLQQSIAAQLQENIRRQLAPIVGTEHFQVSVEVALNTDRQQTNETIYNPDSRVERSVRSVREKGSSRNALNNRAVTVEQNIPHEAPTNVGGQSASTDTQDRREEVTNYEINSKTISTVRDGYSIDKLDVAVVIDRARLKAKDAAALQSAVENIRKMVATAAGIDEKRGDKLNVAAIDFVTDTDPDMQPMGQSLASQVATYVPTLLNTLALMAIILLIIFFGIRPLLRELQASKVSEKLGGMLGGPISLPGGQEVLAAGDVGTKSMSGAGKASVMGYGSDQDDSLEGLRQRMRIPPQNRLEKMLQIDEERFGGILRNWLHEGVDAVVDNQKN